EREDHRGCCDEGGDEHDVARAERDEVALRTRGMSAECTGIHCESHPLGMPDRTGQQRHDVTPAARYRCERTATAVVPSNSMGGADHAELVAEPRHETVCRKGGVADPVGDT